MLIFTLNSQQLQPHPLTARFRAVAFFKGKVITAGGKISANTATDIHTFTTSEGWVKAGDLPSGRFKAEALVLDEGTTQV